MGLMIMTLQCRNSVWGNVVRFPFGPSYIDASDRKPLTYPYSNVFNCFHPFLADSMMALCIAQVGLQEVTSDISKLVNLKRLELNYNRGLQHLPESMSCLQKLESFNISDCSISELPAGLGSLASLADLHASGYEDLDGLQFPDSLQVSIDTQ
jgi:hypothetical protein